MSLFSPRLSTQANKQALWHSRANKPTQTKTRPPPPKDRGKRAFLSHKEALYSACDFWAASTAATLVR